MGWFNRNRDASLAVPDDEPKPLICGSTRLSVVDGLGFCELGW